MKVMIHTILHCTSASMLEAWLQGVAGIQGHDLDVVIIDNSPVAGTWEQIVRVLPSAHYVPNAHNVGFAAGVNQAKAFWQDHDALFLVNPDVVIPAGQAEELFTAMRTGDGVLSGILMHPDGSPQRGVRRLPTLKDQLITLFKLPHLLPRLTRAYLAEDLDLTVTQPVESVMGAVFLISRQAVEKVGWFDDRFFIWFEEVDYCARTLKAGLQVRHIAGASFVHGKGVSFAKVTTWKKQKWWRQSLRKYARKHWGVLPWLTLWVATPFAWVAGILTGLMKWK